jgi:uncharacterized protein (TIGR03067 family)
MKRLYSVLCLSLGLLATGCAADRPAEQVGLRRSWQAVAAERNGTSAPDLVGHSLAFTADRFQIARDGALLYGGTYTADLSVRPAHIEFRQDQGRTLRGEWKGIYRFEGSRLEIIDNADDVSKPRPTQFVTTPGSGYVLVRFEPK